MLLSQTSEYALRAMAWLATARRDEIVTTADLSVATGIPSHYLAKILRRLVLANLLESRRGHGGGFYLARAAEKINFIDILGAVDAYPTRGRCAFGWGKCDPKTPCPLHESWSRLNDRICEWAEETSLKQFRDDSLLEGSLAARRSGRGRHAKGF